MPYKYITYIFYGFVVSLAEFKALKLDLGSAAQLRTADHVFINVPQSLKIISFTHQLITERDILQHNIQLDDLVKHDYIEPDYFDSMPCDQIATMKQTCQKFNTQPDRWLAEFKMTDSGHLTLNHLLPIHQFSKTKFKTIVTIFE